MTISLMRTTFIQYTRQTACLFLLILVTFTGCKEEQAVASTQVPVPEVSIHDKALKRRAGKWLYKGMPFTGTLISRYQNGKLRTQVSVTGGYWDGWYRAWYPDGSIQEERQYNRGLKAGHHWGCWENGRQKFSYEFAAGRYHGAVKEWYPDGSPYRHFNYKKGREAGAQKLWRANGQYQANYVVRNNRRYGLTGLKLCVKAG